MVRGRFRGLRAARGHLCKGLNSAGRDRITRIKSATGERFSRQLLSSSNATFSFIRCEAVAEALSDRDNRCKAGSNWFYAFKQTTVVPQIVDESLYVSSRHSQSPCLCSKSPNHPSRAHKRLVPTPLTGQEACRIEDC
ncbi:hypothetical protein BJS_07667 [Bradyrhizobium japonicum SEMIA 5079]|uniref:Uncharacterized protein n=1 Tax=Bradyrhizobium diazoefficiens SEMIA 5080 TaxID=754504 RepID=A0A837CE52_9BRAD|nr:hypothetical protein BJS_07667 [Bradyrhizobium japonicum SEMIA 5079]KGJ67540.1 hypothetical protein BJA5080_07606 [Bradyrhizobium diazoefficiens SEMIA 5080]